MERPDIDAIERRYAGGHDVDSYVPDLIDWVRELERRIAKVEEFHPRIENPRHGCCAPPRLCTGHADECGSHSHGVNRPQYPCVTVRILRGEK